MWVAPLKQWPLAVGEHFTDAAQRVCAMLGLRLVGVTGVRHILDVSGEEATHNATMCVGYAACVGSNVTFEEIDDEIGPLAHTELQVYEMEKISWENTPVVCNEETKN